MWNFIKCVFKFVFSLVAITTLVAGVGVVAFAYGADPLVPFEPKNRRHP